MCIVYIFIADVYETASHAAGQLVLRAHMLRCCVHCMVLCGHCKSCSETRSNGGIQFLRVAKKRHIQMFWVSV